MTEIYRAEPEPKEDPPKNILGYVKLMQRVFSFLDNYPELVVDRNHAKLRFRVWDNLKKIKQDPLQSQELSEMLVCDMDRLIDRMLTPQQKQAIEFHHQLNTNDPHVVSFRKVAVQLGFTRELDHRVMLLMDASYNKLYKAILSSSSEFPFFKVE